VGVTDLLANKLTCERDVPYFQQLGINTLLVSQFALGADRSPCLQLLSDAGIYLILQLDPKPGADSIGHVYSVMDYTVLDWMSALVDEFHDVPHVLGMYLYIPDWSTDELPRWRGLAKVVKEDFVKAKGYRNIPIGILYQIQVRLRGVSVTAKRPMF
jgi:Glucanosyltransferase